jgi:exodeoxyribonuclease VII large subunit
VSDISSDPALSPSSPGSGGDNLPEFTVSEISQAVKRTLESSFERVRVRGEISGFKRAASGHLYMTLKDEQAVLDAVCWRGIAGRLAVVPEDGLEVIAIGRITSYPGRSKYQIVIESLELAGEGALLKLLEDRRKKLAAEGLFAEERKKPLPYLPEVIGVVTSPTGAVIRDVMHRLADRFPRRVLLWPVLVQGEGAAGQIAAAIEGFNALPHTGPVPRPDLLIVARGGGSLEDLWAFNEEVVVRAAAASDIPLISAVGHETDTTLIDHAADRRAPTPSAAAEIAVPVRRELIAETGELSRRLLAGLGRRLDELRTLVEGLARGLPRPERILEEASQRLDDRGERLAAAAARALKDRRQKVAELAAALPHPRQQLRLLGERLSGEAQGLERVGERLLREPSRELASLDAGVRLGQALARALEAARRNLAATVRVLESVSYHNVLDRGFAVVHGADGIVQRRAGLEPGTAIDIEFSDGRAPARITGGAEGSGPPRRGSKPRRAKDDDGPQGRLL